MIKDTGNMTKDILEMTHVDLSLSVCNPYLSN